MTYDFEQSAFIPATPSAVYDAWMTSAGHSAMTETECDISGEVGGEFTAGDGYITGRNLELEPGHRILQAWRTTEFADDDPDSIVEVRLAPDPDGTVLTLSHRNVPSDQHGYEDGGWEFNYFLPMVEYFSGSSS